VHLRENFLKNVSFFNFFPLSQKNLFGLGQKVFGSKAGRPLIYCGSKVCSGWVGSGPISSLEPLGVPWISGMNEGHFSYGFYSFLDFNEGNIFCPHLLARQVMSLNITYSSKAWRDAKWHSWLGRDRSMKVLKHDDAPSHVMPRLAAVPAKFQHKEMWHGMMQHNMT